MKKLVTAVLTAALAVTSTSFAFAAPADQAYEAAKLKNPVTVDGKVDGAEWDDANALVVNGDTTGAVWATAVKYTADEFSVTYKIKWDENNMYILEQRKDVAYKAADNALTPWTADGSLLFFVSDGTNAGRFDLFFTSDKAATAVRVKDPTANAEAANFQIASTREGDVSTTEIIVPWADMNAKVDSKFDIKEGAEFTFTPILPNNNEGKEFAQLHYCTKADANDPSGYAPFKLVAAKAGDNANNESSTTTPPTGDNFGAIIAAGVIGAAALTAGVLAVSKKKSK